MNPEPDVVHMLYSCMYSLLTSLLPNNYTKMLQDFSDRVAITIVQAHIKSRIEFSKQRLCTEGTYPFNGC